ncbi:hypothetical protein TNIN_204161 [Trichonephila inaurata madagascariensis]|uniref:Uncharacterized protein n=1 Tax=Trichonephila inaurata madagascariensis TaxID=2747483 RepID=A0A8X6X037_9ARAC|nr:hypothetical protein TNIN_204161 [Trichonephila inaurata madagascariensis]
MLLGYQDVSLEAAYGAVVYMHCVKEDGTTTTKLIGSKISCHTNHNTPSRLELSASLLLAHKSSFQDTNSNGELEWKHIPAQNPADIILHRGVNPEELSSLTLWWNSSQHLDIPEQFIKP